MAAPQLVVTATQRESDAVLAPLGPAGHDTIAGRGVRTLDGLIVATCGIGAAEAAATTAAITATIALSAVWSVGVAGGHDVPIGGVAVGRSVSRADTGIEFADGSTQTTRAALGIGESTVQLANDLVDHVARRLPGACLAHVLTVATVTGTAERAARVLARAPNRGAAVEDMEAWGVLVGTPLGMPFLAVKTVSNAIGPRDRDSWDLVGALAALSHSSSALFRDPIEWS